jgi:hypothetical protein
MFALILRSAVLPAWRSSCLSTYNTLFTLYNDCLFSNHQFMEETMSEKKNLFSVNPDVSRRDFLRLSGLAAAGVMVAACGTPPAPGSDAAPAADAPAADAPAAEATEMAPV